MFDPMEFMTPEEELNYNNRDYNDAAPNKFFRKREGDGDRDLINLRGLMKSCDMGEMMAASKTKSLNIKCTQHMIDTLVVEDDFEPLHVPIPNRNGPDYNIQAPLIYGDMLRTLSWAALQAPVCAALNSHTKMTVVLGMDEFDQLIGVKLSMWARDKFKSGLDDALTRGIVPPIPPCMYDVAMAPVNAQNDMYSVMINVDMLAPKDKEMYQLANGHKYILVDEKVVRVHEK